MRQPLRLRRLVVRQDLLIREGAVGHSSQRRQVQSDPIDRDAIYVAGSRVDAPACDGPLVAVIMVARLVSRSCSYSWCGSRICFALPSACASRVAN